MTSRRKPRVVYRQRPRPDKYDQEWHLDKKIPIALVLAMVGQVVLGVSWATTLRNDVSGVKEDIALMKADFKADKSKLDGLIELRGEIKALVQSVTRLERFIDFREFSDKEKDRK
jgi:hypothetical protein